jgi:uncharacterized protein
VKHPAKPIGTGVPMRRLSFLAIALSVALLQRASADNAAQTLPFFQDWTNTSLIAVSDNWSRIPGIPPGPDLQAGVPGLEGFRGDGLTASTGGNPQSVLAADTPGVLDVNANLTAPNTFVTGGVAEFHLADPVVALSGSGTARAPYLLLHLNTIGRENVRVSYLLRDLDGSMDNAISPVALHYRIGGSGLFTDVPAAFVADASTGPSQATLVTPVAADLPAALDNQPLVQLRIMTTDAAGNDEWIGIDDIRVESDPIPGFPTPPSGVGAANPSTVTQGAQTLLTVAVTPGTNPTSTGLTVTADLTPIGGSASQAFLDDGMDGDVTAGDSIFSFRATVAPSVAPGSKALGVTIGDDQARVGLAAISLTVEEFVPFVAIHDIQGTGPTSAFVGQRVKTTGIVTGIRPSSFYIQTPEADVDGDPKTSEGLLIFRTTLPGQILRGDLVEVTGRVVEFVPAGNPQSRPVTELQQPSFQVLFRNQALPAPATLTPADTPTGSDDLDLLERYEGMRVHIENFTIVAPTGFMSLNETGLPPTALPSTSNGVFVGVVAGVARPFREPGLDPFEPEPADLMACVPPSPCVPRFDGNPERIRVDSDAQLEGVRLEVAAGQTVEDVVGPLDYESATWSIALDPPIPPGFVITPPQAAARVVDPPRPEQFTVASFNLQRLFDACNDPLISEPVLTQARFDHRLNKLSRLVRTVLQTPDIIGVSEAENLDPLQPCQNTGALRGLAAKINADAVAAGEPDPGYVPYLIEGNDPGGIDVGFLVKSTRVEVVEVVQEGKDETYTFPPNPTGVTDLLNDRPPLVLRALVRGPSGDPFPITVIANHLRSLLDVTDPVDGPRVRFKRRAQAEFLANLIQARQIGDPNERIIVLGDMNAFQFNDGLVDSIGTIKGQPTPPDEVLLSSPDLVDPDLIDLVERVPPDQRYSFVFNGSAQELDHILITKNLESRFTALQYGRANADFPDSLRNDPNRAERTSDHDPLVAYFTIPSLSIDDVTVTEGDERLAQAQFTVTLQRAPQTEVTVGFATEDGRGENGAIAGVDYVSHQGTLTFQPGETVQTILVDVIGDRRFEPDELFVVKLSGASANASIARPIGTGTILNDDVLPVLTIEDTSVDEHDKFARVRVRLPAPADEAIVVNFTTVDGTATDGVGEPHADYVAASGTLVFNPGDISQAIQVALVKDRLDEPVETFFVDLAGATNATIGDGRAVVTIRDNDRRPRIRIRNARADEPAAGSALMTFRVELSAPSRRSVTVDFRTFNLTAVAGLDYEARTGTLTFAPGETEKTIDVTILADSRKEHAEHFAVKLSNPVNGTLSDAVGRGTIDPARSRHTAKRGRED